MPASALGASLVRGSAATPQIAEIMIPPHTRNLCMDGLLVVNWPERTVQVQSISGRVDRQHMSPTRQRGRLAAQPHYQPRPADASNSYAAASFFRPQQKRTKVTRPIGKIQLVWSPGWALVPLSHTGQI